jgi:hypothetical protein
MARMSARFCACWHRVAGWVFGVVAFWCAVLLVALALWAALRESPL